MKIRSRSQSANVRPMHGWLLLLLALAVVLLLAGAAHGQTRSGVVRPVERSSACAGFINQIGLPSQGIGASSMAVPGAATYQLPGT